MSAEQGDHEGLPPWPPERFPTPEEWRDWFVSLDPEEQLSRARKVVQAFEVSWRCLIAGHEQAVDRVQTEGARSLQIRAEERDRVAERLRHEGFVRTQYVTEDQQGVVADAWMTAARIAREETP